MLLLLLLLSHFSRVQLCATPETAAHQAPPSLGFSRQERWSGLPLPSPMRESEIAQSCPTLATPWTASYQAPLSMGFSRQKYWSGVPLPSPMFQVLSLYKKIIQYFVAKTRNCIFNAYRFHEWGIWTGHAEMVYLFPYNVWDLSWESWRWLDNRKVESPTVSFTDMSGLRWIKG